MGSGGAGNGRQPEEAGCLLLYSAFWYNLRENRKGNNKKRFYGLWLSSVTFFRLLQLTVWRVMKVLDAEAVYPVSSCDKAWPGKILFDRVNKT